MGPARHWAIQLRSVLLSRFSRVGLEVNWTYLELTISLSCMDNRHNSRNLRTLMSFSTFQSIFFKTPNFPSYLLAFMSCPTTQMIFLPLVTHIISYMCESIGNVGSLQLSATKSRMGHAEPAAAVVGIANLAIMLGFFKKNAIMSLRQVRAILLPLKSSGMADKSMQRMCTNFHLYFLRRMSRNHSSKSPSHIYGIVIGGKHYSVTREFCVN